MKVTEAKLEQAIIDLLGEQGYPHVVGSDIDRGKNGLEEVLIKEPKTSLEPNAVMPMALHFTKPFLALIPSLSGKIERFEIKMYRKLR